MGDPRASRDRFSDPSCVTSAPWWTGYWRFRIPWECRVLASEMGSQGDEAPVCLAGRGAFPPECCGGPTGSRLMLKRQQKGETMGTPAQGESVISLMTAAHPDTPQSSWELLRDVMDDGMRSLISGWSTTGRWSPIGSA